MISNFGNNHLSGNFKGQHLCWNVNEYCDVYVAIDRAGYQSNRAAEKKMLFRFSWFFVLD